MYVVTGATGNVGRTLVRLLTASGAEVTAVSRNITEVPAGARALRADLSEPGTLKEVFGEAEAVFLLAAGDLLTQQAKLDEIVAAASGSGRIVALSSQAVVTRPDSPYHGGLVSGFERAVKGSGARWTLLRPGGFASNAFAWAGPIRANRTLFAPFGDVGLPIIDPDDIAAVAAAAMLEPGHAGESYVLTGPEPVSPRQMAAAIGGVLGERVEFVEQTREEARGQLLTFMPGPVADATLDILGSPTPGEREVSPDVARVLGRSAGTFARWAERNAAAFR
ncbi:NAD(P)H-binding protein [Streptomyces daliensis]|uniref:NAD(P)H-binding protein n=1 Tax=Streptomyces daliensis TaxID=299421 RepID=A0A8T4ISD2_9ACTN|nr:NAD(P)H-binding protein [Streptomyces daliensis]